MLVRPGLEPSASRSADRRLSHWANRAAVKVKSGLFHFSTENTEVNENNEYLHFISLAYRQQKLKDKLSEGSAIFCIPLKHKQLRCRVLHNWAQLFEHRLSIALSRRPNFVYSFSSIQSSNFRQNFKLNLLFKLSNEFNFRTNPGSP